MTNQTLQLNDSFKLHGEVRWIKYRAGTKEIISESPWMKNKIMAGDSTGISILLDRLIADNTYSGNITHADIGTGTTAPDVADTALETPVVRASIGLTSTSSNTRSFRFFYPDALTADDTYTEFGMFIDGSASVSTGRIFNHLLFSVPLVKATGEDNAILVRIKGNT